MALSINSIAPDFEAPCTKGLDFKLSDYKGISLILYFYPKNFTPGCTKEACGFRDNFELFKSFEIPIFGISRDSLSSHKRFIKVKKLPFDLITDSKGEIAELYDAKMPFFGLAKRITYLIGKDQKIEHIIENNSSIDKHIESLKTCIQK